MKINSFSVCVHKQQDFPKKLPMSQSVPQIYTQVKEFIYASLKFSESLHRRYTTLCSLATRILLHILSPWTVVSSLCNCQVFCVSSSTEIDDMLRKSTNLLLTRTLSSCLQNLIKKPHIGLTEVRDAHTHSREKYSGFSLEL